MNGIEHYLLHYPKGKTAPILLYLHGGPGFPEHLKQYYSVAKVVILGHSWGSLLGSLYALKYPQNVAAYIGSGQIISMMDNEREGYIEALKLATDAGNQCHIEKLRHLGNYPPNDVNELLKLLPKLRKIQESYEDGPGNGSLISSMLKSPFFKLGDIIGMIRASKVNKNLIPQMLQYNLYEYTHQYSMPVFYILGELDTTTPVSLSKRYFETIKSPFKSFTIIPNAWHNPMYERPEEYAKILSAIRDAL